MKNKLLRLSAVLVPCLFGLNAFAGGADVKVETPTKLPEIKMTVKPAEGVTAKGSAKTLDLGGLNTTVAATPPKADACVENLPDRLAKACGGKVNAVEVSRVQQLIKSGILIAAGDCGKEVTGMSDEAICHLVKATNYAFDKGILTASADTRLQLLADGLNQAFLDDGVNLGADEVMRRTKGVVYDCHFMMQ